MKPITLNVSEVLDASKKIALVSLSSVLLYGCGATDDGPTDFTGPTVIDGTLIPADGEIDVSISTTISAELSEALDTGTIDSTSFSLSDEFSDAAISGTVSFDEQSLTITFTPNEDLESGTLYTAVLSDDITDEAGNGLVEASLSFTTAGDPPDREGPEIVAGTFSPLPEGVTGVDQDTNIEVRFNEQVDHSSIDTSTFIVTGATSGVIAGVFTITDIDNAGVLETEVIFDPTADLNDTEVHTVELTTGIIDLLGNTFDGATRTFTTVDLMAPSLQSSSPVDGGVEVAIDQSISATFDESLRANTIDTTSFTLVGADTGPILGAVSYNADTNTVTFDPLSNLSNSEVFTGTLSTAITDTSGNALTEEVTFSFTTEADTTPPTIVSLSPVDGAIDVVQTLNLVVTFNESMDAMSITDTSFTLSDGTSNVAGVVTYADAGGVFMATFNPSADLGNETVYTATISADVADAAGNNLGSDTSWSFTTIEAGAVGILSRSPDIDATDVSISATVSAIFNDAVNANTVTDTSFTLEDASMNAISGTVEYVTNDLAATLTPSACLDTNTVYTATLSSAITGEAGGAFSTDNWSFTTGTSALLEDGTDTISNLVVSSNSDDIAVFAWLQSATDDDSLDVVVSVYGLDGCETSITVIDTNEINDASALSIGMADDGSAIALWLQDVDAAAGDDVVYSLYDSVNNTWSAPAQLDPADDPASISSLSVASTGYAIATWLQEGDTAGNGQNEVIASIYDPSSGWGAAEVLDSVNAGPVTVSADIDSVGNAVAAFIQGAAASPNLRINQYTAGAWGGDTVLDTEGTATANPFVYVNDATGDAVVAWLQDSPDDSDNDEAYAALLDLDAGVYTPGTPLVLDTADGAVREIAALMDDSGTAYVIWTQGPVDASSVSAVVFDSAVVDPSSTLVSLEDGTEHAQSISLAFDSSGNPLAVWSQLGAVLSNSYVNANWQAADAVSTLVDADDTSEPVIATGSDLGIISGFLKENDNSINDAHFSLTD